MHIKTRTKESKEVNMLGNMLILGLSSLVKNFILNGVHHPRAGGMTAG